MAKIVRLILGGLLMYMMLSGIIGLSYAPPGMSGSASAGYYLGTLFMELLMLAVLMKYVFRVGRKRVKDAAPEAPSGPPAPPKELLQLRERQQQGK